MLKRILLLAALGGLLPVAPSARADEIIFKKEFGGEKVECEIYKEDDEYVHYIDVKRNMNSGAAKEIIEKIVREDEPLVDVEAFFLKKAEEAGEDKARAKAQAILEELRKAREADEQKKAARDADEDKQVGNLLIRSPEKGVTILPVKHGGSEELLVDPFPEEDENPPEAEEPAAEKKPAGRGRRQK